MARLIHIDSRRSTCICACASLRRASRAVCHLYDLVLAPTGLKVTQFVILDAIYRAREIAHCDLARQLVASEETLSRRLASARAAGWVNMSIGSRSRRMYSLSVAGRDLLESAMPYWERAQERMRRELGETDWQNLGAFSEKVTDAALRAEIAPMRNDRHSAAKHGASAPAKGIRSPKQPLL
jgi:DNA-binding MarR family transcriptional regulator